MNGRTRTLVLALAAGAGIAILVAVPLLRVAPSPEGAANESDGAPPPPATVEARLAAGARPSSTSTVGVETTTKESVSPAPEGSREVRVHGTVRAPASVRIAGAIAYVFPATSEALRDRLERESKSHPHGSLGSARVGAGGRFELTLTAFPATADRVEVVVEAPGFASAGGQADVPVSGGDVPVDVSFVEVLTRNWLGDAGKAPRLTGRVVDDEGRPLAGLPLLVQSFGEAPESIKMEWTGAGSSPVAGYRGRAVTDASGTFEIVGLQCGHCGRAFSASPDWFLLENGENRALMGNGATLTARPAIRLVLEVLDDAGAPLPTFAVHVASGADPVRVSGSGGRTDVLLPSPTVGMRIDVAVSAEAFRSETFSQTAERGPLRIDRRVTLRRMGPDMGTLRVMWVGPGASRVGALGSVVLRVPGSALPVHEIDLGARRGGSPLIARLPVGEWECEFRPDTHPEESWCLPRLRAEIRAGHDKMLVVQVPAVGRVFFLFEGADVRIQRLLVTLSRPGADDIRFPAADSPQVPAGEWDFSITDSAGRVAGSGHMEVKEGEMGSPVRAVLR